MNMNWKPACGVLFLSFCVLLLFSPYFKAANGAVLAELDLQNAVREVLRQIDSEGFAAQVTDAEYIVKAYLLVKGRQPEAVEFYYCQALLGQDHFTRSNLLALLLAGEDNEITWDECQTLLDRDPANYLQDIDDIRRDAQILADTSRATVIEAYRQRAKLAPSRTDAQADTGTDTVTARLNAIKSTATPQSVANESYNTYFGYLHAHTDYSDGEGTPYEAYQYARDSGKLDFFAVTDHGELIVFWPWQKKWQKIKTAAEANYIPGYYVTLWGFEWSNPLLGHICVLNTDDYTSCLSKFGLGDLYNWLEARPDGFGFYCHPGSYDVINAEFEHLEMTEPEVVPQMVGIETWNGSNSFDRYYYQNKWKDCQYSYLDTGNRNGWYLGALGSQDNHDQSWGTKNEFRTAVLAKKLTRTAIIEAYRNRRFYATEDRDLYLDFRCSGYPMGSQLNGVSRVFTVTATDRSHDTFSRIRFYRNGDLIATQSVAGSSVTATFTDDETTAAAYYYVIVTENDDNDGNGRNDEAISSAIWVR
jgi:hypothetical protein